MPIVKATNLLALKKLIKMKGETGEQEFLNRLSPKGIGLYNRAIATDWISSDDSREIFIEGAKQLFPNDPKRMIRVGRTIAKQNMTGVYRIFLKIPTISFILKRVASLWRTFYKKGNPMVKGLKDKSLILQVDDFPDMEDFHVDLTSGYILQLLEMTGAKNVSVKYDGKNPNSIKWNVSWS